jgi:hypothetical protein
MASLALNASGSAAIFGIAHARSGLRLDERIGDLRQVASLVGRDRASRRR